ncbi:hypothetical protein M885DRAFT_92256 [Pelagophyceae sp. CCMP2097]|nr:hypothetical protein M885DRAFT_92256 [Pelagophyceae sp. CCMP2097]
MPYGSRVQGPDGPSTRPSERPSGGRRRGAFLPRLGVRLAAARPPQDDLGRSTTGFDGPNFQPQMHRPCSWQASTAKRCARLRVATSGAAPDMRLTLGSFKKSDSKKVRKDFQKGAQRFSKSRPFEGPRNRPSSGPKMRGNAAASGRLRAAAVGSSSARTERALWRLGRLARGSYWPEGRSPLRLEAVSRPPRAVSKGPPRGLMAASPPRRQCRVLGRDRPRPFKRAVLGEASGFDLIFRGPLRGSRALGVRVVHITKGSNCLRKRPETPRGAARRQQIPANTRHHSQHGQANLPRAAGAVERGVCVTLADALGHFAQEARVVLGGLALDGLRVKWFARCGLASPRVWPWPEPVKTALNRPATRGCVMESVTESSSDGSFPRPLSRARCRPRAEFHGRESSFKGPSRPLSRALPRSGAFERCEGPSDRPSEGPPRGRRRGRSRGSADPPRDRRESAVKATVGPPPGPFQRELSGKKRPSDRPSDRPSCPRDRPRRSGNGLSLRL